MEPVPVPDEPALLCGDMLVVADLHIGIERELADRGVVVPSRTGMLWERLLGMCRANRVKTLVILGDLKHKVPLSSYQEEREIPAFMENALEEVDVVELAPGNHDGGISSLLPDAVRLRRSSGFTAGDMGMYHGHTWPSEDVVGSKYLLMAHNHAGVALVDTLGLREVRPCWVRARLDRDVSEERYPEADPEVIIMPAFNPLCWGTAVNEGRNRLLGPMLKNGLVDLDLAEVYLLDGTFLGKLGDLEAGGE